MQKEGATVTPAHEPRQVTVWDLILALADLDNYVGKYNPTTKELEIRHRADLNPNDRVIEPRDGTSPETRTQNR